MLKVLAAEIYTALLSIDLLAQMGSSAVDGCYDYIQQRAIVGCIDRFACIVGPSCIQARLQIYKAHIVIFWNCIHSL